MTSIPGVPAHLTIRVIYSDENIVVVDKPCDLRSVPGHANPPPPQKDRPRPANAASSTTTSGGDNVQSHRMTAQEAWVKAIQSFREVEETNNGNISNGDISMEETAAKELLCNLGSTANPACVPRKFETYVKYCHRNSKRLLPSFPDLHAIKKEHYEPAQKKQKCDGSPKQGSNAKPPSIMRAIAEISYSQIQMKQRPLMNLPKPTEDHESAIGQLRMMGFGDYSHCAPTSTKGDSDKNDAKLYVVHRLDCQTSGLMVVARNRSAASTLSEAWRERDMVKKVYLAHVRHWLPYHEQNVCEGTIDIPLAPSRTERIKWEVRPLSEGGKECKTYWKVHEDLDNTEAKNDADVVSQQSPTEKKGIILELHPITGRTHQLRIHCASIGSGIVGDSLYGDSPIAWIGDNVETTDPDENPGVDTKPKVGGDDLPKTLRLHAHKLTFPDPKSGEKTTLESPKAW